jgi:3-oxoacyl-[acyl-carrier protein] reductase
MTKMKRALITGGSGDLGMAICQALAPDYELIIHSHRNSPQAKELATAIRQQGGQAQAIQFDLTDRQACQDRLTQLVAESPIQVLVHNAGIHADAPLAGMNEQQWESVMDVCLNGFYRVSQPLLLPMISSRWGRIIIISSVAAVLGNRGQANYAAAKAGLIGAAKSLAREVATRGITVNVVAPGIIQGKLTAKLFDQAKIKAMVPMERSGQPEEVADLVAFLASQQASYISAQVIGINGGMA